MASHNDLGKLGEDLAVNYLLDSGYVILARNYMANKAEIDIIARKNNVLAIVEVKTRSTVTLGRPEEFLKPAQMKNLIGAVNFYVRDLDEELSIRFDIAAVVRNGNSYSLTYIEDAFYHF